MRRLLPLLVTVFSLTGIPAAHAGGSSSWIFSPSYYSHDPVQHVRIGTPQVPGGPYYSRPQGQWVNSGYRYLHSTITVGGQCLDHLNVWESWIQSGEQY
jgi:hypothetical protein